MVTLVRVRLTCPAAPSQWDGWDAEGQYYYLRYRFGRATVDAFPSAEVETWPGPSAGGVAMWTHPDRERDGNRCFHGYMTLREFCQRTGLTIAAGADVRPKDWNEDEDEDNEA